MILNPIGDPQVTHNHSGEIRAFWVIAPFRKLPWDNVGSISFSQNKFKCACPFNLEFNKHDLLPFF